MHLGTGTGTDVRNTTATLEAPVTPVTVGGKTYQFVAATESWGTAYRLEVKAAA